MCSVLCTGRKLLAHSRNCKLGLWSNACGLFYVQAHHTHQYPHPLLELQGHTRNHMCLVVYAGLLRHMLKLPASQSCNLLAGIQISDWSYKVTRRSTSAWHID
ncbi:uncharacterized protein [Dermacentor albipictus]|uniref:uncharacterized protein isoform X5 n=1 Tax=Dermacentor albipictus TaxID=60249 RepID=UPI0038FCD27C